MIFIYIAAFFIVFMLKYKKTGFSTSALLLFIYLISAIFGAILLIGYEKYHYSAISIESVAYNLTCLTLFFAPLVAFDNFDIRNVRFPNLQFMKAFAWFIIILCISSLINSFVNGFKVFFYSDLAAARLIANEGSLVREDSIFIITYLGSYGTQLSLFALILYFYFNKFVPNSRLIQNLLFIGSFQIIIVNLIGVGRDGTFRWIIFYIFCLSLFKEVISRKDLKKILLNFLLFSSPFIFIFIAISIARASDVNQTVSFFIIDYIGQPFINFSRFFKDFIEPTYNGRLNFPAFFPDSEAVSLRNLWINKASGELNVFTTFIGSFLLDFGAYLLFIFTFIYFIIAKISFRIKKGTVSFTQFIMYCWLVQVFMLGVFYYMFTSPSCIRVFFILLIVSYSMQIFSKQKFTK